jgi:NAD-dependent SIR2 family protein deacetylase
MAAEAIGDAVIARVAGLLGSGPLAVITGAGLSTASGIPAYRDRHGQWQHARPIQHQDFLRSEAVRRRYWARSYVGWQRMARAVPSRGHRALAALERRGLLDALITQNVDGLHQRAGSVAVIELHGGIARVRCLACAAGYARAEVQRWLAAANPDFATAQAVAAATPAADASTVAPAVTPAAAPDGDARLDGAGEGFRVPDCPACGGVLKPDVVFFGDNVPHERVAAAAAAVERSAALLVVGSSLMVWSGYRFAEQAHRLGRPLIAINQGVTRADALLAAKIEHDCGEALERLLLTLDPPGPAENSR